MIFLSALLGAIGLVCILYRNTFMGFLIGLQLLVLGATSMFVFTGAVSGWQNQANISGFLIAIGSLGQMAVGFSFAVRLFYLKKKMGMDELRSLKH